MTKVVDGSVVKRNPNTITLLGYIFLYLILLPVNQGVPMYLYMDSFKLFFVETIQIIPVCHPVEAYTFPMNTPFV